MGLKTKLVKMFFPGVIAEEVRKSSKQVIDQLVGSVDTDGVFPDVDFEVFNQMYEQTSWVRAVVGVICKAVTARGYTLTPAKPDADPKNFELLSEFFGGCNPNDTLLEILDDITRDEYVFGNAFLELVYGADGKPKELWNLDATTVRVKADEHGTITGYVQSPRYASRGAARVDFESKEVIHFKLGTKGATLYGLSPLASLILPVTVDKFAQVYNRAFFVNGAKIRGAFIMKDATPEQVERNREYLQARAKNPDMAHSDLVLEGSIEFKQIGVNQKDMEFLELREFTRNEILAVYGVPPGKVCIIETGNIGAGSGEHQTQTFYEETILPFQMRVAEKITKHVIRQGFGINDWSFQFNKRSIDEKDQAEIFNIYLQNGVFTPEEVRRMVAPRMPEIRKSLEAGKALSPSDAIVETTRMVVDLENRFVRAMQDLFREIRRTVIVRLPELQSEVSKAKAIAKQLPELEAILEAIDQGRIAEVIGRFTLEAARLGLKAGSRRAKKPGTDQLSRTLEEKLRADAFDLAGNVSDSLKRNLRSALMEGIAASETIPQLMGRIEDALDSSSLVDVASVLDAEGNVIREGGTRRIGRSTAAEALARTEANRAFNAGNLDALAQADVREVVFLLASDACEECRAVAETDPGEKLGKKFSLGEARNVLPVHPNCRCTFVTEAGL
ncbi:MAG: phage portal protein [Elusimicrobia bacterium RIFCSPLOWO2_01_FULL_59_12]|nr:MAG: phage portal protein [Elusimicrobia bacterium RIFCSPLOWO2_01_FULL_59_12]